MDGWWDSQATQSFIYFRLQPLNVVLGWAGLGWIKLPMAGWQSSESGLSLMVWDNIRCLIRVQESK